MKTAGQLLREKRELKELTIGEMATRIKVKPEYLFAIENSDFSSLPTPTATKGFLRNYARALHLNPDTIVAMFRRDWQVSEQGEIVPHGLVEPVAKKPRLISANALLTIAAVLIFVAFLGFQLYNWWSLPKIDLIQPDEGEVYGELVTVKGTTNRDATITINDQQVLVNDDGQFTLDLLFPAGTHSVLIKAVSRQGKTRLLERTFQISK
jgi:cytoskeleton protein RodZ